MTIRASLLLLAIAAAPAADAVVHKVAESFDAGTWAAGPWVTAKISAGSDSQVPGELGAASTHAMKGEVTFAGSGFAFGNLEPARPLVIPGVLKSVSLWYKGDGSQRPLIVNFVDAWGRSEIDGRKCEWQLGSMADTAWRKATFTVPADWKQPVRIAGVSTHNWGHEKEAKTCDFWLDQLEVDTDLAGVDVATGRPPGWQPNPDPKKKDEAPVAPLLETSLGSGLEAEVFTGTDARFAFTARSWTAGAKTGSLRWTLSSLPDGVAAHKLKEGKVDLSVDGQASLALPMPVPAFGLYRLDTELAWADGGKTPGAITFAAVPPQPELSDAQKDASPWGLNDHGGQKIEVASYRKAGVVWFRDYAFTFDWLLRAKGDDKQYAGWPWYPKLRALYADNGARVLPVLVGAIRMTDGVVDRGWRRDISDILSAFPGYRCWELDNEHDGSWTEPGRKEAATGWTNYRAYHKAFGELLQAVGGGELAAVENGRAGIYPDRVEECVKGGDFDQIQVVNVHHYCGVDAPETNIANSNTGGDGGAEQLFHDRLRSLVAAAHADGRKRQAWLTEFGWDTRAGQVVSPLQQAAYLQRGFLTVFHAGIDKAFWYWWHDAEKAETFFGGCGLLDFRNQPKLGFAAYAGIASLLPSPQVGGLLDAGPGTFGYLLRQDGKRIAALWTIEDVQGPEVTFSGGSLRDALGNPIAGRSVKLGLMPVYAVDLPEDDRFARQGAWDLASPWRDQAAAGDELGIVVSLSGDRSAAITGSVSLEMPSGWTAPAAATASAKPGEHAEAKFAITIPPAAKPGEYPIAVVVSEGGKALKRMAVHVAVVPALAVRSERLAGEPGATTLKLTVENLARRSMDGEVTLELPASWSTTAAKTAVAGLKPGERRAVAVPLTWGPAWKADERAQATVSVAGGGTASTGIIPAALPIHRVASIRMDGDLADWPAASRVSPWALAGSREPMGVRLNLGWNDEGLLIGLAVDDSNLIVDDPRSFWHADCMELLLDPRDRTQPRPPGKGDLQFWFVPQPARGAVYAGQWKRGDEIDATRYDIPGLHSAAKATGTGYTFEVVLPKALVPGLQLKPGASIAGQLMLAVHGKQFAREVGWPATKSQGGAGAPEAWPRLVLAE